MKLVKKWLFPVLTCLIVAGAAVLPPHISQLRDARLFGQVHTQELAADPLPVYEPPGLLDRIKLYTSQGSFSHPVLSFEDVLYGETADQTELVQTAQGLLIEADILPRWIFQEEPFEDVQISRLMLWDPEGDDTFREPTVFTIISWSYNSNKSHQKSIRAVLDAETGLPIDLYVHDTNMSQWLPYQTDDLRALAGRFFDLIGLEAQEIDLDGPGYVPSLKLSYSIAGTGINCFFAHGATDLMIELDYNWRSGTETDSTGYDD